MRNYTPLYEEDEKTSPLDALYKPMVSAPVAPAIPSMPAYDPAADADDDRRIQDKKANLAMMGGLANAFGNQQSWGNFFTGRMNPTNTAGADTARALSEGIESPAAKRRKQAEAYLTQRGLIKAQREDQDDTESRDPNSEASRALASQLGGVFPNLKQFIDGKSARQLEKMMPLLTEKSKEMSGFENQKKILGLGHSFKLNEAKNEASLRETAQTAGQKSVDTDYAKQYNDFTTSGAAAAEEAMRRYLELSEEVEKDTGLFQSGGGRVASLPDAARSRTAIRRRDSAVNLANTTLKSLFGRTISDSERLAAAKEYYNDSLPNEENAKLMREKLAGLKKRYQVELEKARYYENNRGSLRGFRGSFDPPPSTQDRVQIDMSKAGDDIKAQYEPDVLAYASKHRITPEDAKKLKEQRTRGK